MIKRSVWLGAVAVVGCGFEILAVAGELRAGVGKASISPSPNEFPYAAPDEHDFVDVHDDVFARAIVLDDGERRAAIVIVESTRVPNPDELLRAIAREIGVHEASVMLAATHTHNVPLFSYHGGNPNAAELREMERVRQGALAAARQAHAQMQPVNIAFGRGEGWINVNNGEQSGSRAGYDPNGVSDKTLDVLRLVGANGAPVAMLVNYASHAEVMFRSVTKNAGYEVSGDLPGAVSRLLESVSGAAPVVLFTSAAEADQLTLFKSLLPADRGPATDEGSAGWALLDVQARRLAGSVMGLVAGLQPGTSQGTISVAAGSASCPGQKLQVDLLTGHVTVEDKPPVRIPLSVIRIYDIVLAGVGGDVGSDIGRHFKAASPVERSMLISMAGGDVGYILSDMSYEHPGHGVMGSPLKPHCAENAVVTGLIGLIKH